MGEDVFAKYSSQLADLKINSKPVINMLTMMAEDHIRHAPVVVQAIEKHLATVKPELKLPALYLIDSIIKNVKKEYRELFTQNIISTFCGVFEKVDEKVRGSLWKVRGTWNDQIPERKLYAIDVRCHEIDPKWPIMANPPQSSSIHVNPKFINRDRNSSSTAAIIASSDKILGQPSSMSGISLTTGSLGSSDVEIQAKVLAKQRELIELQEKKLQIELLQTKLLMEEKVRKQKEEQAEKQLNMAAQQEKLLLDKAEKAKKTTERMKQQLSVSALPHKSSTSTASQPSATARNSPSTKFDALGDRESPSSTSSRIHKSHSENSSSPGDASPTKKSSKSSSRNKDRDRKDRSKSDKSKDRQDSKEKDSRRSRHRDKDRHRESRSSSKDKTRRDRSREKSSSPLKSGSEWKDYNTANKLSPSKRSHRKDSDEQAHENVQTEIKLFKRTPSPTLVPTCSNKSPGRTSKSHDDRVSESSDTQNNELEESDRSSAVKRKLPKNKFQFDQENPKDKNSENNIEVKIKNDAPVLMDPRLRKRVEKCVNDNTKNEEENNTKPSNNPERDFRERQRKVLSRNYRRTPGVEIKEDTITESEPDKMEIGAGSGDRDLRIERHMDVDLRSESDALGAAEPPVKKSKRGNEHDGFDDLFGLGQQDVDYRAGSSCWTQVKSEEKTLVQDPVEKTDGEQQSHIVTGPGREAMNILRPQAPPSPADSVESGSSVCDPLGRPLVFSRLPSNPEERKRTLGTRAISIDPVVRFRINHVDSILQATGEISEENLKSVCEKAKDELDRGIFSSDQYIAVMKQVLKVHEATALRDVQMKEDSWQLANSTPGPNPWVTDSEPESNNIWATASFGPPPTAPSMMRNFPNRFAGPGPWGGTPGTMPWVAGAGLTVPQPTGPNPFEEAIARPIIDDIIPKVNKRELQTAEQDVGRNIPIDKVQRQIRFYQDTTIVFMGLMNDDPRELSFQRDERPRTVLINGKPLEVFLGEAKKFDINRVQHVLRIGTPGRELCIDDRRYEVFFGGRPIKINLDGRYHTFQLLPPTPQVSVGQVSRYDLCAGRVNLILDAVVTISLFLDERHQKIDIFGEPVVLKFFNGFQAVSLNGRPFPTNFGARLPFSITLPGSGKHFLRFSAISPEIERAIQGFMDGEWNERAQFATSRGGRGAIRGGRGRGGNGRGRGRDENRSVGSNLWASEALATPEGPPTSHVNQLDLINNIFQSTDSINKTNMSNHTYESETKTSDDVEISENESSNKNEGAAPKNMNVTDLVANLIKFGLLPTASSTDSSSPGEPIEEEVENKQEKPDEEEEEKVKEKEEETEVTVPPKPVIQPLPTEDVSFDQNLRDRRPVVVSQILTGVQCSQCGLRFAPDQTLRYSQHLDWHFRQNRRDKANAKKALSRKWYYDLSDWIQFEEIEDLEERAASLFESQDADNENDAKSPGNIMNPEDFTVLASSHEGAVCPQCGESFESYFDEEKEEWRLKSAKIDDYEGVEKVYHPVCHQDYLQSLVEESVIVEDDLVDPVPASDEVSTTENEDKENVPKPSNIEEEDDEVLIIKEGKKEIVVMEIDIDDDDVDKSVNQTVKIVVSEDDKPVDDRETKTDENNSIINIENTISSEKGEMVVNDSSMLSDNGNVTNSYVPSPIIIDEDSTFLPGFDNDSNGGVFGFALGADKDVVIRQPDEDDEKIVYEPMKFDFPKIKLEPPDEDETMTDDTGLSQDGFMTNLQPFLASSGESVPMNVDLTEEDSSDAVDSGARLVTPITRTSIDGNLQHDDAAALPFKPASKIRINISGVDVAPVGSPKEKVNSPQPIQGSVGESESSDKETLVKDDGSSNKIVSNLKEINKDNNPDEPVLSEEMKRLKPRLVGRKLTTCPPKFKGTEESGLCVIC